MPGITCPKCRATNASDAKFCQECGEPLPKPVTPPSGRPINVIDNQDGATAIGDGSTAIRVQAGATYVGQQVIYMQAPQPTVPQPEVPPKTAQPATSPAPPPPVEKRPRPPDLAAIPAGHHWRAIGIEPTLIPGGRFLYGQPTVATTTEAFQISRTTVTNAQYQTFVAAAGYPAPHHWQAGQPPANRLNYPVVNVSWHDAQAFCRWAGVRLPSEVEWEKAARGTDGREYPWGSRWETGRCNSAEANQRGTTPVDRYPAGASPYGVLDMSGNVWEWCADWYDLSEQEHVLRGGSFHFSRHAQLCAWRHKHLPASCSPDFSFRVVIPES